MTALAIVLQHDQATVISDTAYLDVSGYVQGFFPKAIAVPTWSGVIGMRGPAYVHALMVSKAGLRFATFDAFARGAASFLAEFCDEHHEMLASYGSARAIQVMAAGYSPDYGTCRAFIIQAGVDLDAAYEGSGDWAGHIAELANFEPVPIPLNSAFMLPTPPVEALRAQGLDLITDVRSLDLAGVRALGIQMLEAQRGLSGAIAPGEDPVHVVGGRPVFLTVRRDGITTSVGPAWPDRIGERINPAEMQPLLGQAPR